MKEECHGKVAKTMYSSQYSIIACYIAAYVINLNIIRGACYFIEIVFLFAVET